MAVSCSHVVSIITSGPSSYGLTRRGQATRFSSFHTREGGSSSLRINWSGASFSGSGQAAESDKSPYQVLGVNVFESFDKIKTVYAKKQKDSEKKGDEATLARGSTERSYVMIKPDGVQRGLVGEIISRFERKGFTIKGLKLFSCSTELAEEHYKDLSSKSFFPKLVKYITSGPVVCLALEGPGVVASARKLIGVTNPLQAEPGTIRGDLGIETGRNVIHGSDSPENGEREIGLWFEKGELCEWEPTLTPWLREQ